MTEGSNQARHYWERITDKDDKWRGGERPRHLGRDLAALRSGVGHEAGTVPAMWPYYATLRADGIVSNDLRAEHLVLSLFAVHQQSIDEPMHRHEVQLGAALRELRASARHREQPEALDRRFAAAATATTIEEVSVHLRSLINLLRREKIGLDHTLLYQDLKKWPWPASRGQVRRRWGSQYFGRSGHDTDDTQPDAGPVPSATSNQSPNPTDGS